MSKIKVPITTYVFVVCLTRGVGGVIILKSNTIVIPLTSSVGL